MYTYRLLSTIKLSVANPSIWNAAASSGDQTAETIDTQISPPETQTAESFCTAGIPPEQRT